AEIRRCSSRAVAAAKARRRGMAAPFRPEATWPATVMRKQFTSGFPVKTPACLRRPPIDNAPDLGLESIMILAAQRQWARADVLRWAILGTVVFGVGVTMLSAVEVQRARRDVHVLSRSANRSTAVVGEVGRHIMQLRLEALAAILVPPTDGVSVGQAIATI